MDWKMRRGQIKHLLYEHCLSGRITMRLLKEQFNDLNNVEPVKHSKRVVYYHGENTFSYNCGSCHMPIDGKDYYCKWCGARMDEAEE